MKSIYPFWITRSRSVLKKLPRSKPKSAHYRNRQQLPKPCFPKSKEQLDDIAPILKNTEVCPEIRRSRTAASGSRNTGIRQGVSGEESTSDSRKLLKYARSLFRENTELKAKVQKLEKENTAFKSANWNHANEIVKLKMENQGTEKDKGKLDALVGRIGNDVLQKLLSETPKEQPKHKEKSL